MCLSDTDWACWSGYQSKLSSFFLTPRNLALWSHHLLSWTLQNTVGMFSVPNHTLVVSTEEWNWCHNSHLGNDIALKELTAQPEQDSMCWARGARLSYGSGSAFRLLKWVVSGQFLQWLWWEVWLAWFGWPSDIISQECPEVNIIEREIKPLPMAAPSSEMAESAPGTAK